MVAGVESAIRDVVASASLFSNVLGELVASALEEVAAGRVSVAQSKVLTLIAHTEGIGVGEVAMFLGVSSAAASKAVARLVEDGFIERSEAPDDRRAHHLSLTDDAWDILTAYEERTTELLTELFGHLDGRHLRTVASSLDALSVTVAQAGDEGGGEACFRCGIYFRNRCLLRTTPGTRTCYRNLGKAKTATV